MFIVDTNVLLHAVNTRTREHAASRGWLRRALSSEEAVLIPWIVAVAFLRLTTRPGALEKPLHPNAALELLGGWLNRPNIVPEQPTPRHYALLRSLLARTGTAGNLVNDAHIAALALEHDATVISFDHDFGRFEGVRWRRPE